jgi:hypothetical protein
LFFENKQTHDGESNTSLTEDPDPPDFRGDEDDGRVFKIVAREDAYIVEWDDHSQIELIIREQLRGRHNTGSKSSATRTDPITRTRAGWNNATTGLIARSTNRPVVVATSKSTVSRYAERVDTASVA